MFDSLETSATALMAQRVRMDTIAGNVANINVTRDENGQISPYRRRFVVFATGADRGSSKPGVHVHKIELDSSPFRKVFDPGNPDAASDGYVSYPNVDMA